MCLSFTPAVPLSQNLLYQARVIDVGLGERRQKKRTFFIILHSRKTTWSIWMNTAFPLNSYKQLLPSTKSAWDGGSESWSVCFSFCLFNFFPLYYYEIFIPSSSRWPYQYITVVFRNSLPSATEDTHKPGISQELTSCWWWWRGKKRGKSGAQDVIVNVTSKCCPAVSQFQLR